MKRIAVAMSGGIDSSVTAALLKERGCNITGVFMRFFSSEAEERARRLAAELGITFRVFNFEKEFKKRVIDYFLTEHRAGRTPNPCVVCNKEIKFGLLLEKALALGADFLATGHYVRLLRQGGRTRLFRAKDKKKDQSYFLWRLKQNQLKHILFPLGDYTKTQVRNLAKKFKLPVFDVPESMEICFIRTTIDDFLKHRLKLKPGRIVDSQGKIMGQHQGLYLYTIGQRRGIGLSCGPFYVLDKDLKNNRLIVTKNEKDLYKKEFIFENANWLSGKKPKFPLKIKAKIRYRQPAAPAVLMAEDKGRFDKSQRAITAGQSAVFYQNGELAGGGIIC